MIKPIPAPVDDAFFDAIDALARARKLVPPSDPRRLAPLVAKLAAAYNDPRLRGLAGTEGPGLGKIDHLSARLGFSLARDVPKVAGAVREAIAIGALVIPEGRPLRVLDLGAGLGASHRGLARALDAAGAHGTVDVLACDADGKALELLEELARARPREGNVSLALSTAITDLPKFPYVSRPFDVVLLGQVLSELDVDADDDARLQAHHAFLSLVLRHAVDRDRGLLVVVEPALRARARHLQRLRGALLADGAVVVSPCLHADRCPLLGRDDDWCHEDLPVDLPPWLAEIARLAGLRWQGLTFTPLVVAHAGRATASLRAAFPLTPGRALVRAVSSSLVTKGKVELIVCGDRLRGDVAEGDPLGPHGARIGRLDRARSQSNAPFDDVGRGDLLDVPSPLDEKLRVRSDDPVTIPTNPPSKAAPC